MDPIRIILISLFILFAVFFTVFNFIFTYHFRAFGMESDENVKKIIKIFRLGGLILLLFSGVFLIINL